MGLLWTMISSLVCWLWNNLYDLFAFVCAMHVTVSVLHLAMELVEGQRAREGSSLGDSLPQGDTEEVFEECFEEFAPLAPLAESEVFGKMVAFVDLMMRP
ncbi:hypothetical protein DPMN_097850 [Dreissena polymorpha]|uniref:Uncharacterized protein n=1 Tax=Dreissena polymorpha TaxID=45954 RepID=A0A9D4R6Q7_DREPO|nr:hypothetical protein DPMN_097850 [Dreissena polymorpha]